jgi:hypothetical protein
VWIEILPFMCMCSKCAVGSMQGPSISLKRIHISQGCCSVPCMACMHGTLRDMHNSAGCEENLSRMYKNSIHGSCICLLVPMRQTRELAREYVWMTTG